jgi:hypothetical protein
MCFVPLQVKGQISDMALCTIDEETKISILAKLFFTELARKGNALYNVMPDIISRYRFLIRFYLSISSIVSEFSPLINIPFKP